MRARCRAGARVLAVGGWTTLMVALLFCAWLPTLFGGSRKVRRAAARRRATGMWGRGMMRVIGVRVAVEGRTPPEGILLVSNHMGYLDIPVLASVVPMVFVAKAELRRWPFWGHVASAGGTIYVDRSTKRDVLRVRREMGDALGRGSRVLVFPEGTSTGGETILPFKPALLADAAAEGTPVYWATVTYRTPPDGPPARNWVSWGTDLGFVPHLLRLFTLPRVHCTVRFGDTPVRSRDRKALAADLRSAMLGRFEPAGGWEAQARALIDRAWRARAGAMAATPGAGRDGGRVARRVEERVARRVEADLELACEISRRNGAKRELSVALGKLGHVALDAGRTDKALVRFEESVEVARETGDPLRVAHAVRHVGHVHQRRGRLERAERAYREALDLYRDAGAPPPLDHANALRPLALLREECGDADEAKDLWRRAARLYRISGVAEGVEECEARIARLTA